MLSDMRATCGRCKGPVGRTRAEVAYQVAALSEHGAVVWRETRGCLLLCEACSCQFEGVYRGFLEMTLPLSATGGPE